MILLLSSFAALALGPLVYRLTRGRHASVAAIDGFVVVAVTGLIVLAVFPEAVVHRDWAAFAFAALGLLGPSFSERVLHAAEERTHGVTLLIAALGLAIHAFVDGTVLGTSQTTGSGTDVLPIGIVLHRFPVGLAIWWLLRPTFGILIPVGVLTVIAVGTALGFNAGPTLLTTISSQGLGWFQAFVAGSLLHVVFHRPHHRAEQTKSALRSSNVFEGLGAIAGVLLIVALIRSGGGPHGHDYVTVVSSTFLALALDSAPALLIAYTAAGLLGAFAPRSSMTWLNRGSTPGQAIRGMAVGLPLPICSCGVVPLYRTLIVRGAPPAAAMAFLVSTPELGLDAIFLSVPLLGVPMTIIRVVGAAIVAWLVGWLVGRYAKTKPPPARPLPVEAEDGQARTVSQRIAAATRVGFGDVVDDTAPWILLGLAVAAFAAPLLEGGWLAAIPAGIEVPLYALLGLPTYVCASAATPVVAVLLAGGATPGAALAFLITGPATNVTTFGVLSQLHGRQVAAAFAAAIIAISVLLGYVTNVFFSDIPRVPVSTTGTETANPVQLLALLILTIVFLASLLRRGVRGFVGELSLRGGN